ncbi:polymorphic toxin-type HINT domain-containing protein [Singulisphaera sp. PoT]|uniref:polymorphic toxin-type HINT domain-containing protein n=1 Tax=Singulisphaera sp. PoT TaxID=3411797 RepID=UPI003BF5233F
MFGALFVALALVAAAPDQAPPQPRDQPPSAETLKTYEKLKQGIGRDADAQVRLALWCEAHGLKAEQVRHLALAVLTTPNHAKARGLLGLATYRGKWQRPEAISGAVNGDEVMAASLAEYNAKRAGMKNTAEAHWKLGLWCDRRHLEPEAMAHFSTVLRLDPSREGAWRRLGFKKKGGRWVNEKALAEAQAEAERQKEADRRWRPQIARWRDQLKNQARRAEAEEALAEVTDPGAVPAVWASFARGNPGEQLVAVRLFSQIDAPGSSKSLAFLAAFGGSGEVRRRATEVLRRRDPREFANVLIALLREPVKYEVQPVAGPGSPGAVFVKGERFNVQRLYAPPPLPFIPFFPGSYLSYDDYGLPVLHQLSTAYTNTSRISADQLLPAIQADRRIADRMTRFTEGVIGLERGDVKAFGESLDARNQMQIAPLGSPSIYGVQPGQMSVNGPGIPYFNPQTREQLAQAIERTAKAENSNPSQFGFTIGVSTTVDTQIPVGRMMLEAQKTAQAAQQQLQNDVASIDAYNREVSTRNTEVGSVLDQATGQSLGGDRKTWDAWWTNQLGYAYKTPITEPAPTFYEEVPLAYQPQPIPIAVSTYTEATGFTRMSCFGAGTPVRTLTGIKAIESLEIGDRVLTQDIKTGELRYKPILLVHRNPPSATFAVEVGGETIVSSHFHRFWKAGQGWVMARDLKQGDTLRTLEGLAQVDSIVPGSVQPVFNLDVADDADFFVGKQGALVHDNTLPSLRLKPFDAPPTLMTSETP